MHREHWYVVAALCFGLHVAVAGVEPAWARCQVELGWHPGDIRLGIATSFPGDLNADGFLDFAVGATSDDGYGDQTPGRVWVYFGGAPIDHDADLFLAGEATGDRFGYALAGPGDLNGDGFADFVVGAYGNDAAGPDAGRVYVYFGGPQFDSVADLVINGSEAGARFGFAVAGAGDPNADGHADLVVGAPVMNSLGRAFVYFGGNSFDAVADRTLQSTYSEFGSSVLGIGRFNSDDVDDIAIGAPNPLSTGRAVLYFGSPAFDSIADMTLTGNGFGSRFGTSLATGDVNADGWSDIVVGAPQWNGSGAAWAYFGGPTTNTTPDVTFAGAASGSWFGRSVAAGADLDGDGYSDVVVGAPMLDSWALTPRVFIYRGGPSIDGSAERTLTSGLGDAYGWSTVLGPDMDADGKDELLVGEPRSNRASLGVPPCLQLESSSLVSAEPGISTPIRFCVRSCENETLDLDLSVSSAAGWSPGATKTITLSPGDSACIEADGIAPIDESCSTSDTFTFAVAHAGCTDPSATRSLQFERVIHPAVVVCSASDSVVAPGDSVLMSFVLHNPNSASRQYFYWINESSGWCGGTAGATSVVLQPNDSLRVDRICVVPTDAQPGFVEPLSFLVRAYCGHHQFDGCAPIFRVTTTATDAAVPDRVDGGLPILAPPVDLGTEGVRISYGVGPDPAPVRLELFDIAGRRVRTLVERSHGAGRYSVIWDRRGGDGRMVGQGVYLVQLRAGSVRAARKVLVVR